MKDKVRQVNSGSIVQGLQEEDKKLELNTLEQTADSFKRDMEI